MMRMTTVVKRTRRTSLKMIRTMRMVALVACRKGLGREGTWVLAQMMIKMMKTTNSIRASTHGKARDSARVPVAELVLALLVVGLVGRMLVASVWLVHGKLGEMIHLSSLERARYLAAAAAATPVLEELQLSTPRLTMHRKALRQTMPMLLARRLPQREKRGSLHWNVVVSQRLRALVGQRVPRRCHQQPRQQESGLPWNQSRTRVV
jgi:hypothetical protein